MNALIALLILHSLLLRRWRGRSGLAVWLQTAQDVLQSLELRRYAENDGDPQSLRAVFHEQLRHGRMQPHAVRSLLTWIRALERADAERLQSGYAAALRLGMGAALAILTSILLEGVWLVHFFSNPPIVLLMLGDVGLLSLWLHRLKSHPLAQSAALQAEFTQAWLGSSQGGPWHENWIRLQQQGRQAGRDMRSEQIQILEDWLLAGMRQQEKDLTLSDELFGLVELASSVYFLGTACALPLLKLWGG